MVALLLVRTWPRCVTDQSDQLLLYGSTKVTGNVVHVLPE